MDFLNIKYMNKLTKLTIALSAIIIAGCSTLNNVAVQQGKVVAVTATGTEVELQQNPNQTPYFVAAEQVLNTIGTGTNDVSVSTVEALLQSEGETNPIVNLAIADGLGIADAYVSSVLSTNATQSATNTTVKTVCLWISQGISQGVNAVPAVK